MQEKMVKDLMTQPIRRVGKQAPLQDAARAMRERDIGCVAVADEGKIEGLVTDRDIVTRGVAEGRDPRRSPIADVMTRGVWGVRTDDPIDRATQLMIDKKVRRLLVFDDDDNAIGIVSLGDISRHDDEPDRTAKVLERVAQAAPTPA